VTWANILHFPLQYGLEIPTVLSIYHTKNLWLTVHLAVGSFEESF
jgi:hypothetical protein